MVHIESILQRQCVKWFRYQYPQFLIYANANGGRRSKIEAAIMQGEGVLSGVPDLTVVLYSGVLWIEMKAPAGKLTDNQRSVCTKLNDLRKAVHVCRSLDEFISIIEKSTKP